KEERSRAARVVLKPDKLLLETSEGLTLESDYRLDPLQKTIDVIPREGGEMEKGKTFSGIYLLDGDRLKICLGSPEQKRPGEFSTKDGKGYMLYVLQREPAVKGEGDLKEQLQQTEAEKQRLLKENLKLKLENEKLRAENELLKLEKHKAKGPAKEKPD